MLKRQPHRKRIKHYDEFGDFHELTFSCYHRWKLLTNDTWRGFLARAVDDALVAEECCLAAFVFMPEHVHLLIYPADGSVDPERVSRLLGSIKRPCSAQIKEKLSKGNSRLLDRLTIHERPGKTAFRFWQEGPGYDRNLQTEEAVYHVTACGNEQKHIYRDLADRERFLETLEETVKLSFPATARPAIGVDTRCSPLFSFPPFSFLSQLPDCQKALPIPLSSIPLSRGWPALTSKP
jgi:putative transposase